MLATTQMNVAAAPPAGLGVGLSAGKGASVPASVHMAGGGTASTTFAISTAYPGPGTGDDTDCCHSKTADSVREPQCDIDRREDHHLFTRDRG
jgi:hypothetical protein